MKVTAAASVPGTASQSEAKQVEYAVEIIGLSKFFRRQTLKGGYTTLKSSLLRLAFPKRSLEAHVTKAIQNLTVRIPKGASVGIIGRNGSGKSTLLKLISGIYKPDAGKIALHGRVAALIELGAGFHPDFTGRENLYLGGVMHGLTRAQIDERFDDIVKFAELEEVIDDPVRTYSSGMFMRLGFSLAVHTDPDVLIIDEVLAVGDAAFVSKCKERIARLRKEGKTLLLVTHDLDSVERWCDEAVWLHEGVARDRGDPRRVIDHYRQFIEKGEETELEEAEERQLQESAEPGSSASESGRWGSREIEITSISMRDSAGTVRHLFHAEDSCSVEMTYKVNESARDYVFGIGINRADGLVVYGTNTEIERLQLPLLGKSGTVSFQIPRIGLQDGSYTLDVAVHRMDGYPFDYHKAAVTFVVRAAHGGVGVYAPAHRWLVDSREPQPAGKKELRA